MMVKIRKWVAMHEAGHAIASLHMSRELGHGFCQFRSITVEPVGGDDGYLGYLDGPPRYVSMASDGYVNKIECQKSLALADCVETLTWPYSEARFRKIGCNEIFGRNYDEIKDAFD